MKKLLIATTALTMLAGAASADVTLSGLGYFGLAYDNGAAAGTKKTQLLARTQIDIAMTKTTDSGLTFFGKFRIRSNAYDHDIVGAPGVDNGTTPVNGGQVGVSAGGLSTAVGNVGDAVDASNLFYNSEIGICGCGGETLQSGYEGYSSQGAGNAGVLATYTMGSLVLRAGYQSNGNTTAAKGEASVGVDYKMGALAFGMQYINTKNTGHAISGQVEYALGSSTIGLAVGNSKYDDFGTIYTIYGNTKFGATTVSAFVSQSAHQSITAATKTTYGIGGSYDLGSGAAIVGSVRQQYSKKTYADLGVTFSF